MKIKDLIIDWEKENLTNIDIIKNLGLTIIYFIFILSCILALSI